tara:strand:+ start:186 stop:800 length:615 start_codon:yes stop_codon:yes gene_type:complete
MSKLHVDEIKGNTGTTVTLTSGQTLAASGATISGNPSLSGGLKTGTIQSTGGTTAMTIDSAGRVLTPTRPMVRAIGNNVRISVSNGYAVDQDHTLQWTEEIDIGSNFANNTFTCPIAGLYYVNVNAMVYGSNGGHAYIRIVQNSSQRDIYYINPGTGGNWLPLGGSTFINASVNDTITSTVRYSASNTACHEGIYRSTQIFLIG